MFQYFQGELLCYAPDAARPSRVPPHRRAARPLLPVAQLDDANLAGTARSRECTLIVTEGDSAKSLAVSGLGVVGRDRYGIFPLKGKPLNVRDATHRAIMKNEEIMHLVEIMGLKVSWACALCRAGIY